jgi:hypothetical protein
VSPPGTPHSSFPIWYAYSAGGEIRISTPSGSRKLGLIQDAGYVGLAVQQEEMPYKFVSGRTRMAELRVRRQRAETGCG